MTQRMLQLLTNMRDGEWYSARELSTSETLMIKLLQSGKVRRDGHLNPGSRGEFVFIYQKVT